MRLQPVPNTVPADVLTALLKVADRVIRDDRRAKARARRRATWNRIFHREVQQ